MLVANIFIGGWLAIFLGLIYASFHDDHAGKMHRVIMEAIHYYHADCIKKRTTFDVDYTDMEDYYKTCRRWWDWGYKRILPKDKFEIIQKYIDEVDV